MRTEGLDRRKHILQLHGGVKRDHRVVAIAERLGRLRRVGLHEAGITVGKIEGKEVDLARHAADHRHRLAEVRLGVAGGMDERHEHLARPMV